MTPEILKTVGQVAGIGGLALGIFLRRYRDVIRLKIFPKLTAEQAFRVVVLLLVLVWSVAIAGLGVWAWVTTLERGSPNENTASASTFEGSVGDDHEETTDGELIYFVLDSEGERVHMDLSLGHELADEFEKLGTSGYRTYSLSLSALPEEPVFMELHLLVEQGDDFFFGVQSPGTGVLRGTFHVVGCAQVGTGWFSCELQALRSEGA
jgi:hypothetical protein